MWPDMTPEETKYYEAVRVGPIPLLKVSAHGWRLLIRKDTKAPEKVLRTVLNHELEVAAMRIFTYHHIIRKLGE